MNKLLRVISLIMVVSMVLAACATATQTPTTVVTEAPAPVVTEAPAPVVTEAPTTPPTEVPTVAPTAAPTTPALSGEIRIASWDSADALAPFNEAIDSFKQAYPNVKVNLESVPQSYGDKLLAEFASGTAPDVFQVGDGDVAKLAAQGVFEPLDEYFAGTKGQDPLDTSVFYPAIFDIGKVGGKTYLLAKDYGPLVLYYNKNLFDAAGVAYPTADWTWDDMLADAQKLTVKDSSGTITQWGLQLPDSWGDWVWLRGIFPLIYQNGGDIISSDGTKTSGYLDSDATVQAIQWYTDLFLKEKVAPTKADVAALTGVDLFQTGKVAMLWSGPWNITNYSKDTTMNFGMAQLPVGKQRGNSICWAGFAMYSGGKNKDAAWAFLRWIGAGDGAKSFAKYALTDVQAIAESSGKTTDPYWASVFADLPNVHTLPDFTTVKFGDCVYTPLVAALEDYFNKGGDLKTILTDVATQADACLAKK